MQGIEREARMSLHPTQLPLMFKRRLGDWEIRVSEPIEMSSARGCFVTAWTTKQKPSDGSNGAHVRVLMACVDPNKAIMWVANLSEEDPPNLFEVGVELVDPQ